MGIQGIIEIDANSQEKLSLAYFLFNKEMLRIYNYLCFNKVGVHLPHIEVVPKISSIAFEVCLKKTSSFR